MHAQITEQTQLVMSVKPETGFSPRERLLVDTLIGTVSERNEYAEVCSMIKNEM